MITAALMAEVEKAKKVAEQFGAMEPSPELNQRALRRWIVLINLLPQCRRLIDERKMKPESLPILIGRANLEGGGAKGLIERDELPTLMNGKVCNPERHLANFLCWAIRSGTVERYIMYLKENGKSDSIVMSSLVGISNASQVRQNSKVKTSPTSSLRKRATGPHRHL